MKRPKNFLFHVILLSVVAVALLAARYATRRPNLPTPGGTTSQASRQSSSPFVVSGDAAPAGTPSVAAQKRAKDFNDATNRLNAPDAQ